MHFPGVGSSDPWRHDAQGGVEGRGGEQAMDEGERGPGTEIRREGFDDVIETT